MHPRLPGFIQHRPCTTDHQASLIPTGQWTAGSRCETHTATPEWDSRDINPARKTRSPPLSQCVLEEPEPRGSAEGASILCSALMKTPCLVPSSETLPLTGVDIHLHRRLLALALKVWGTTVSSAPESALLSQLPIPWHQRYPETFQEALPCPVCLAPGN